MAYRLKTSRSARRGLRKAARKELEKAANALGTASTGERTAAIHEARKSVKKTRAALRLARSGMPRDVHRERMRALRDTGRLLAGSRDADVLALTIDGLAERYVGHLPATELAALRADVAQLAAVATADEQIGRARVQLEELAAGTADWPLGDVRWSTVRRDAARTYQRGREGFKRARGGSDPELLHEWRKRVKDLWYHQRLLRDAWKPVMDAHVEATHRLSELLGDDHDLYSLTAFLDAHRAELARHRHLDELVERIAQRRAELQADAFALGAKVYAERPSPYGKRIGRYVKVARATSADPLSTP